MKKIFFVFVSLLFIFSYAVAEQHIWMCEVGKQIDEAYGGLKIEYVSNDNPHNISIFAITPQGSPFAEPGIDLLFTLNSKSDIAIKANLLDAQDNILNSSIEKPFSGSPGLDYITWVIFKAPAKSSKYFIKLFDPDGRHATTGSFVIPDTDSVLAVTKSYSVCTIGGGKEFTITTESPYPFIVKKDKPDRFAVKIKSKGIDEPSLLNMFNSVVSTISVKYTIQTSINPVGEIKCSNSECSKEFELTSQGSDSGILYTWQRVPNPQVPTGYVNYGLTSKQVVILDTTQVEAIEKQLIDVKNITSKLLDYYTSIKDSQNFSKWADIKTRVDNLIDRSREIVRLLDVRQELTVSGIIRIRSGLREINIDSNELLKIISG